MPHSAQEKLEIVRKAYADGADKEKVAKEAGVSLSTIYGWKSEFSSEKKPTVSSGKNGHAPKIKISKDDFVARVTDEKNRLLARVAALDAILDEYSR